MKNVSAIISLVFAIWVYPFLASANPLPAEAINTRSTDSTNTCGDPYQTMVFHQGYNQDTKTHTIYVLPAFVTSQALSNTFLVNAPLFRAWSIDAGPSQPGTTPLFFFQNTATTDYIFVINPNGGSTPPPAPSGFVFSFILGYVYPTQICGSVPLYVASNPTVGDHFYTADPLERDFILQHGQGWVDQGIAAYVLPLNGDINP